MKSLSCCVAVLTLLGVGALAQDAPKKVTHAAALSAVATRVQPDYPAIARQLRLQGSVELEVQVGEAGEVTKVDIVSGNPMFTQVAAQALKRWKFKPFLQDGKAIRVSAPITVDFKL